MPRRLVRNSLLVLLLLPLAACTSKPKESSDRWGAFSTDTEKPYSEQASPKSR